MILRQALVLLSVLLQCGAAFAQPRSVTGRVADVNGMPVVGATVVVKEARSSGAITDSDGRYQIRIPEGGKTLLFSFVGYQTQEQVVAPGRTRLDVVLQPSSTEIEQVVVTGYSQTTVKKVTGSVGILTADELKLKPQTSVDALMQGELAGVSVTPTTGRPGASQRIRIRGIANLSGNTAPLWVVDFPLLEWDDDTQRFYAMHHPFTSPKFEDLGLFDTDPGKVRANAYDFVVNGVEVGGGSIRIFDSELQHKMFEVLGFSDELAEEQFGFLMNAFKYGAPPHGGIAFGFDRLCALFGGADSIRDDIAFPKNNSGRDMMIDSPSEISDEQLNELAIAVKK